MRLPAKLRGGMMGRVPYLRFQRMHQITSKVAIQFRPFAPLAHRGADDGQT